MIVAASLSALTLISPSSHNVISTNTPTSGTLFVNCSNCIPAIQGKSQYLTTFGWNILASNSANDNISHYQSQGNGSSRYIISWTANQFTSSILIIVWNVQMQSKSGATLQASFTLNTGLTTYCQTTSPFSDTIQGNYSASQTYSPLSCPLITGATTTTTMLTIPPSTTTTSSSSTISSSTTTTSASTSSTPSYETTTSSTPSTSSSSSSSSPSTIMTTTTSSSSTTSSEPSSTTATTITQSNSSSTSTSSSQQTTTSSSSTTTSSPSTSQSSNTSSSTSITTTSTTDSNSTIAPSISPSSYGDFIFAFNSTSGGSFCTDTSIAVQYSNSTAENPGWLVELNVTLPNGSTQNSTVAYNVGNSGTPVDLSIVPPPMPGTDVVSVTTYYNGTGEFTSSATFTVVDNC